MDGKHFLVLVFFVTHFVLNGASDVTVTEGDEVRLKCERNTKTAVDWKYQRHSSETSLYICIGDHLVDAYKPKFELNLTDFTLTINNVAVDDSGAYSCIEDSGIGETHDIQLAVVRLTTAEEGDQAQLPCDRNNDNPVDWRYQRVLTDCNPYIVIGGRLLDDHITRMQLNPVDYTLTINKVALNDSGFYSCIEDSGIGDSHFMKLIVAHIMTATEGDLVSLKCDGTVDAPVDWRYRKHLTENNAYIAVGGRLLDKFKPKTEFNLVGHTLIINNVTVDDSGFYSCIEGSGETHLVKLNVVRLARAKEGDQARLRCVRSIDKPVDWRYQRDLTDYNPYIVIGGHVVEEYKDRFQLNPADYTLTVNNVSLNDSGFYSSIEDSGIGDIHLVKLVVVKRSSQQSTLQVNDVSSVILSVSTGLLAVVVVCFIFSKLWRGRLKAIYRQFRGGHERQHLNKTACDDRPSELTVMSESPPSAASEQGQQTAIELHDEGEETMTALLNGDQPTDRRQSPAQCEAHRVSISERIASLSSTEVSLEGGSVAYSQPQHIAFNSPRLIELIDPHEALLADLVTAGCITQQQKDQIVTMSDSRERNTTLLDILRHGSEESLKSFLECLSSDQQGHIVSLFTERGVIVDIDATLDETSVTDVYNSECQIVSTFRQTMLAGVHEQAKAELESIRKEVKENMKRFGIDVDLVVLRVQSSIGCYFFCRASNSLHNLFVLYGNQQLREILESIFNILLRAEQRVHIKRLVWIIDYYQQCIQYFTQQPAIGIHNKQRHLSTMRRTQLLYCRTTEAGQSSLKEELYSRQWIIEERTAIDHRYSGDDIKLDETSFTQFIVDFKRMDSLPLEARKLLLMKSYMKLFVGGLKSGVYITEAQQMAYATLASVCGDWWQTLNGRPQSSTKHWVRHRLQRLVKNVCRPYLCRPQLVHQLNTQSDGVTGLTQMDDKIFVVCWESDRIRVFGLNNEQLEDIDVEGLKRPMDIVACSETRSLYVADWESPDCVWRVSTDGQVDKFLPTSTTSSFRPWSLSVTSGRLLVTTDDDVLLLYGADGAELKRLSFTDMSDLTHAVETSRDTFVFCHFKPQPQIVEVDGDGRIIAVYNDQQQLTWPWHLSIDSEGKMFITDYKKHHILLLTSDLQLDRVLLDTKHNQLFEYPGRPFYVQQTQHLLVGSWRSSVVQVFNIQ